MGNKQFLAIAAVLTVVVVLSLSAYFFSHTDITSQIKVSDFPKEIGGWSAVDIPLSERDYEILETRNLIMRDYKNADGESVYLYIIYSEDNRKVSHPPEICYMGSGMAILKKEPVQVSSPVRAIKMLTEKNDRLQLVLYWFKAGDFYTENYLKQQLKIVIDRIFAKRTAGALIRVSTEVKADKEKALAMISSFIALIEPLLPKYLP